MKKVTLFLVLISVLSFAQNNRFVYEYKYIPSTKEKDSVRKEMMFLDITPKGSKYYSHSKFVQDSILKADLDRQIASGSRNFSVKRTSKPGTIEYSVTKSYPDFKVFLHDNISQDRFRISEDEKFSWKILPEKQKIGEYNAQKATASFGGRDWVAWFSPDLPFQDGPYKFYGLPGLIVKVEDVTGSHSMTLVANKKIAAEAQDNEIRMPGMSNGFFGNKELDVDEKKFRKLRTDYLNDPAKGMREMMMRNTNPEQKVVMKVVTEGGREISDPKEIYKTIEKRVKDFEAKNDNRIEPSLYSK